MSPVIGFAGLTHLGLLSAAGAASKGFRTLSYDPDAVRVKQIASGKLPVLEPGLPELIAGAGNKLSFSSKLADLGACDIVYIASDVPTDDWGQSDLKGIDALIADVTPVLGKTSLLVILCQVPPGYTSALNFPRERRYYQVETLVFGRAVERATKPERFIVGSPDPGEKLPAPYAEFLGAFGCPILSMRYESAELAKIAINCCLVASVTVANTLAELSERIGADWREIVPALRLDKRIGKDSYIMPGLGIAGGNLERDLATVLRLAEAAGSDASVIEAYLHNSRHMRDWALRTLRREVLTAKPDAVLAVLGLAYKENTHSIKNSPSLALIGQIKSSQIRVFDPAVSASAAQYPGVSGASSALDAVKAADALLVMTPWPEFRAIRPADLARTMAGQTVIDPYQVLDPAEMRLAGLRHFVLGSPPAR